MKGPLIIKEINKSKFNRFSLCFSGVLQHRNTSYLKNIRSSKQQIDHSSGFNYLFKN